MHKRVHTRMSWSDFSGVSRVFGMGGVAGYDCRLPQAGLRAMAAIALLAACRACVTQPAHPSALTDPLIAPEFAIITSTEQANAILLQVDLVRKAIAQRYAEAELTCHERFFVNSCLIHANELRRVDLEQAKKSEVAANRFKRQARVDEIDRQLEEKQVAHPINAEKK